MPRIHDEDDDLNDATPAADAADGTSWRRRLLIGGLAATALVLGFLIPYLLYLNHEVGERFGQLRWQIPTRVYARPLLLRQGLAMDAPTLKAELDAAGYRPGDGRRAGSYAHNGATWAISSRGYDDVDGRVAPMALTVVLQGDQVTSIRDSGGRRNLRSARLDPARIATLYGQNQEERRLVRIEEVPELLVTGLQAVEDRDFNHHIGIDVGGMLRAVFVNVKSGGDTKQGASTLTQQLARSGLLGIGKEQTYSRKFKEILYALLLDARYDKRTILEAYFNQVDLGQRGSQSIRGVAAASEFWFGKELRDLSTEQIALMIGMVKGPSWYNPRRNPERATERRNFVLGEMRETGLINDAEYQRASKAPLGVTPNAGNLAANRFPAYVDLVRKQLARDYPADQLSGAGLSVMTGMAPSAQGYAEAAVARTLKSLSVKGRPTLQSGLVVTDVHNGDVLAVVGSREFTEAGFNRAVDARRPVGSLLKPFVYLLALAQPDQWSLASPISDAPISVGLGRGRNWTPGNSDGRSHGSVALMSALAQSYNQATVRLGMQVQPQRLASLIRTLAGIEAPPQPSLILGAVDQSPYAMAQLYQFLASGGEIQPLHAVRGVLDAQGRAIKRYDSDAPPAQKGDAVAARLVGNALQYVVTSGTAHALMRDGLGRLAPAGKTGTSNDGRDSWYAGYTGDQLAVVWVGNDQNLATGLYGATGGMRVWSEIFQHLPSAPLRLSDDGIDWRWIQDGQSTDPGCPNARRFPFVAGFAPAYQPCQYAPPVEVDEFGNPITPAPDDGSSNPLERAGEAIRNFFGGGDPAKRPSPADTPPRPTQ
ncbi:MULTISPECIES: penicillin-binding protein 1B [Thermomonas]|jgi:penicillin-binding protein 1B|uniref:Penicillin-binding protein 1B n=1 Tax=Thermomonas beijingensis TaxID=2872701 RepID=A0ABS7TBA5_9GAMM|nr:MULTISPECIES: penicillin-binding protein 1B [Thermomonas]MBS0460588.1 penicillin-binding protein 1B [Pseudomonadota bacterium]MDE2381035.1 penicillin-binding protein 1B [Xanthomonadaceae bacterium]MBZ4185125.1 penicillin-binding protein 1B [Thermomonas beijingensis]HOC11351.1 penicillin-binding protein 1B [Thermomonas sp.]HQA02037.1 penicillin-binding protein 1B [Thermomonas sp.]